MEVHPIVVQNVSVLMALVYGLISFFTPCMFPLIPILLPISYSRGFKGTIGFSLGFVITYAALGTIPLRVHSPQLKYPIAILLVLMGIFHITGKSLKSGKILKFVLEKEEILPPVVLGIGIGWIWMACATPVLGGIISLLSLSESYVKGILLMIVYSLGILVPFLVLGKFLSDTLENLSEGKRKVVRMLGGVLVISSALWIVKAL